MDDRIIEYKKFVSQFKMDSRIKECFHFDSSSCSKIISAHSVQKRGVLHLLEETIDGNLSIYSFLSIKYDTYGKMVGFEPIGKKSASTFFGFCGYHDTTLFSCIENNPVNLDIDEHCFMLSYRAFAREFHAKQEVLQGYKTNTSYQNLINKELTNTIIEGTLMGLFDCNKIKDRLNQILMERKYDQLEYLTFELDYMVPIALSSSITPDYSINNELLNKSINPFEAYEYINFVILPTSSGKTLILLSCLPEHSKSVKFIDQLSSLESLNFQKAISSLAIGYAENTFISPMIWQRLSNFEKKLLLQEIEETTLNRAKSSQLFKSKLNLLDKRFSKNVT